MWRVFLYIPGRAQLYHPARRRYPWHGLQDSNREADRFICRRLCPCWNFRRCKLSIWSDK